MSKVLLGADCQTRSGVAVDNGTEIRAMTFSPKAKRPKGVKGINLHFEYSIAEEYRDFFRSVINSENVTHVAIEEPRTRDFEKTITEIDENALWAGGAIKKNKVRHSSNSAMIRGLIVTGALCGLCIRKNIPFEFVSTDDWRHAFLGFSRAPKSVIGADERRKFIKQKAIEQCSLLQIDVANDDAADAVGIVWWLRGHLNPLSGSLFS